MRCIFLSLLFLLVLAGCKSLQEGTSASFQEASLTADPISASTPEPTPDYTPVQFILYVSEKSGTDQNPGTSEQPMHTIQAALDRVSQFGFGEVRVAAGHYESFTMKGRMSVLGGYSENWSERDSKKWISEIHGSVLFKDYLYGARLDGFTIFGKNDWSAVFAVKASAYLITNNIIYGPTCESVCAGIYIDHDYGDSSVENNEIYGGTGVTSAALWLNYFSHPKIQNNILDGGEGETSYGIYVRDTNYAKYSLNQINGGRGAIASYGIYAEKAWVWAEQNQIHGGYGVQHSTGVRVLQGMSLSGSMRDNRIEGGTGKISTGVFVVGGYADSQIYKNEISGGEGSDESYGIVLSSSGIEVKENNIHAGSGAKSIALWAKGYAPFTAIGNTIETGSASVSASGFVTEYAGDQRLEGNHFLASDQNNATCVWFRGGFPSFQLLRNSFSGCFVPVHAGFGCESDQDHDRDRATCTIDELLGLGFITAVGNWVE